MTDGEAPFDLQLQVANRYDLRAVLHNRSKAEQTFFYNINLQPIELVLIDAAGKHVHGFDIRSTAKFNNTVYRAMYRKLAAGKVETLQTERIRAKDNAFTLQWSPWRFESIPPGTYKAHLVWRSSHDHWDDLGSSKRGVIKDIWKGIVESNTVTIEIPGAS